MAHLVRPFVTAGIAVAGAGLWLAAAPEASATPGVTASTDCADVWCSELFGSAVSAPAPPKLAAAAVTSNPIGSLVRVFIGNGTADNPNAVKLYERVGMRQAWRVDDYQKALPD